MARQERTAARVKQAATKATQIVEETAQRVRKAKTPVKASSPASVDPKTECVRLRDEEGLSWVQIGAKLGLPGSKSGAANARKLYDSTGRDHRSTTGTVVRAPRAPREPRAPKVKPLPKTVVRAQVRSGAHNVIPLDTPDEEIGLQIEGRMIKWSVDVGRLCGEKPGEGPFSEEEARVHPEDIIIERDEHGNDPYITFREAHYTAERGLLPAAYRTVRLSAIHYIGG